MADLAIIYLVYAICLTRRTLREPVQHTGTDFTECLEGCGCFGRLSASRPPRHPASGMSRLRRLIASRGYRMARVNSNQGD